MAAKTGMKKKLQYWGTGRRKKAVARVRLVPGSGTIVINKRSIDEYFGLDTLKYIVNQPLVLVNAADKFDVYVNVDGGGFTGRRPTRRLKRRRTANRSAGGRNGWRIC